MPETAALEDLLGQPVSRETLERLETYRDLLAKWNPAINLVAPSTIATAWSRHFLDSAQVFAAAPASPGTWLDIGSGGGFPGLVCAILSDERSPATDFTLVESDRRKCAFLSTVIQATGIDARVKPDRVEHLPPQSADVVSARAVAPLPDLLDLVLPHLAPQGTCLFPKGARHADEVNAARVRFRFKLDQRPSITDPNAVILVLGEIERV